MILGDLIGEVIFGAVEFFFEQSPRFIVCVLLAVAADVFILWLVPGMTWKVILAIIVTLLGIAGGVLWERQSRSHD